MSTPNHSLLASTSPEVLMNKGYPVQFVKTAQDGQAGFQQHPKKDLVVHHLHIDNAKLAAIEDRWGTLEEWEKQLNTKMISNLAETMSIVLDGAWPKQRVLTAMRTGGLTEYRMAVMAAYSQALGRDPKEIKKAMLETEGDPEGTTAALAALPTEEPSGFSATTGESTGESFGGSGWETDSTLTGSGPTPSDSVSPSSPQWQ